LILTNEKEYLNLNYFFLNFIWFNSNTFSPNKLEFVHNPTGPFGRKCDSDAYNGHATLHNMGRIHRSMESPDNRTYNAGEAEKN